MLSIAELTSTVRARIKDAEGLVSLGRYDAASCICGYSVEIALKGEDRKNIEMAGISGNQ